MLVAFTHWYSALGSVAYRLFGISVQFVKSQLIQQSSFEFSSNYGFLIFLFFFKEHLTQLCLFIHHDHVFFKCASFL